MGATSSQKNTDVVGRSRGCEGVCHAETIEAIEMGTRHIFLNDVVFESRLWLSIRKGRK